MIGFETTVRIGRPIEDVFDFVSDPVELPGWNSAVTSVRGMSGETGAPGSTYSMRRQLQTGAAENGLVLGPLAARAVKRGVDANFSTLKRTLELSRVTGP